MAHPPMVRGTGTEIRPGTGQDPAKYLIYPGTVNAPGRHTPGNLRHARPYLVNGSKMYVFPTPVEGFTRSGQAQLGLRHYLGSNTVDGVTMHYEEGRISLTGTFPGLTSRQNMAECIDMLRSHTQERGLVLYAPGVFEREQYLLPENWSFNHTEDDRSHSIEYSITFVRIGDGKKVTDPKGTPPPMNPRISTLKKGKPTRTFTTKAGAQTLRAIAKIVYKDADKWKQIVGLNRSLITKSGKSMQALPLYRFPIGTKFRY